MDNILISKEVSDRLKIGSDHGTINSLVDDFNNRVISNKDKIELSFNLGFLHNDMKKNESDSSIYKNREIQRIIEYLINMTD